MPENGVLAFQQPSRAALRPQNTLFRGYILHSMRPESPLRQRNVRLRDIQDFVFLDNLGREETRKVVAIQRHYRVRRFFLPLFALMQSVRRRHFCYFAYLCNLSRGYRKTLCHRETRLQRRCIENIAKLARRRYKAWTAERFLRLAALRRIFKRMMAMYQQQARLLKLLRYYQKKYARRLCGWVFNFLLFKRNFIVSLRYCDSCEMCDLQALCTADGGAFKRNYLVDYHLLFVYQKLVYIGSLSTLIFRETLLRSSFIRWLNLRRYKVVSFRARVQIFSRSLHCIFDRWQNESSGRHAMLRYSYVKLRTYCLSDDTAANERRADAFYRRVKLEQGVVCLKKNRVLMRDLRLLATTLSQQKSGLMEYIVRTLIYLERGEVVFVGYTLQKAAFCAHDGQCYALLQDFDQADYKKQSCNRTLFRTYNEEFCIKYKIILRLKELAAVRKAFLRLSVLIGAMCNVARLHASMQCWKYFVRDYRQGETAQKTTRFSDYSDFRGFVFEFLARQEMWALLRKLSHVGNKTVLMMQISASTPYFCAQLFHAVHNMSKAQLSGAVEKLTSQRRFAVLERYLLFSTVIFGLRLTILDRKAAILPRTVAEQDEVFNLHVYNMRKIIYHCDFDAFVRFYRDLLEYHGEKLTNLLQSSERWRDLKRKAVITNPSNAVTFAYLKALALKSVREDADLYERVRYITPLLGYISTLDFVSASTEEQPQKQEIVPCEKCLRMELYGESFPADFLRLRPFSFKTQQDLHTMLVKHYTYSIISSFAEAVLDMNVYPNRLLYLAKGALSKTALQEVSKGAQWDASREKLKLKGKALMQLAKLQKTISRENSRYTAFKDAVDASAQPVGVISAEQHELYVFDCYLYNLKTKVYNSKPAGQLCLYYTWDFSSLTLSKQKQKYSIGQNIGGWQYPVYQEKQLVQYDYFALDDKGDDKALELDYDGRKTAVGVHKRANGKSKKPASRISGNYEARSAIAADTVCTEADEVYGAASTSDGPDYKAVHVAKGKDRNKARKSGNSAFLTELQAKTGAKRVRSYMNNPTASKSAASDRRVNVQAAYARTFQPSGQAILSRDDAAARYHPFSAKKVFDTPKQYNEVYQRRRAEVYNNIYHVVANIVIPAALPRVSSLGDEAALARRSAVKLGSKAQEAVLVYQFAQEAVPGAETLHNSASDEEADVLAVGFSAETKSSDYYFAEHYAELLADSQASRTYSVRSFSVNYLRVGSESHGYFTGHSSYFSQSGSSDISEDAVTQDEEHFFSGFQKKPYCGEFESDGNEYLDLERIEREASREFACELSDRYRNKVLSSPGFADFAKKNIARIRRYYEEKLEFLANDQFMDIERPETGGAHTKLDYDRLERILEARNAKKQTLQEQFEERYVDSLIREKLAIYREQRPIAFMYTGQELPPPVRQNQSAADRDSAKKAQKRAEQQQNSAIQVSELLSGMKTLHERREQQRVNNYSQNAKRVEIISLMFSRRAKTSIEDLARQPPRAFYYNRRDPGRLTASVTIRAVSPAGCVEDAAVKVPKMDLAFSSRRGCDTFMQELAGLRAPELFALFRQFRWRRHIFTPAVHSYIVDEEALRKRVAVFSQRYQRMTFTYLLKALSGVDFSRYMMTTVVTRYVDGRFYYQEITLGFDAPYKPVDVDSLLVLLAKKRRTDSPTKRRARARGSDVYQAIDYYYLSAVGKPVGKCRK